MDSLTDVEMNQQMHDYVHSESCVILSSPNITQPNIRTAVIAPGNTSNIDSHHYSSDSYDNSAIYGMTQFHGIHHQQSFDMGVAAPSQLYYSGMNPSSGTGVLPQPINHRAVDQMPALGTYAVSGFSSDNSGRCNVFMDDARGPYKQKVSEGIRGNYQYFNATASSSVAPPIPRHPDGVTMMDTASFSQSQFRGNGIPSLVEVGLHGSVWNRSGESVMVQEQNHLIQGNYIGQHFQPAPPPWLDPHLNNTNSDGHNTAWNQSRSMPYMQVTTANGTSLENTSMGVQRYHGAVSNISEFRLPPPPVNHPNHNYLFPSVPMQGVRGRRNINFQPPVSTRTYRNSLRNIAIPGQNHLGFGARHGPTSSAASLRMYHPLRGFIPETLRHRNFSPMNFVVVDDVALLDDVGNSVDHHSDMRLDIEDMSYEELLALGERIGKVGTGLSEETITAELKMKTFKSSHGDLEDAFSEDQEIDTCIICQDEYKNQEMIGILKCGHEYHAECLKKWLLVKNVCPVCKSEALTLEGKMSRN